MLGNRFSLAAAMMIVAAVAPSLAQEVSDDIVDATIGEWLIASSDGSPGCKVRLEKDKTIGGRVVQEGQSCGAPWRDVIAAWEFSDPGIVLRDATRKDIIGFQEQEGGPWRTPLEVTPTVYFVPEPKQMDHVPVEKEVYGSWTMSSSKGKTLCHMELSEQPAKDYSEARAVRLAKDCDASVRKTKVAAWHISEIYVVMIGGEEWVYTFFPTGDGFVSDNGEYVLRRGQ